MSVWQVVLLAGLLAAAAAAPVGQVRATGADRASANATAAERRAGNATSPAPAPNATAPSVEVGNTTRARPPDHHAPVWTLKRCAHLQTLLTQDIELLRHLRDAAKWSSIGIFIVGLFLLGLALTTRADSLSARISKLVLLVVLALISVAAFAGVIFVRTRTVRHVATSLGVTYATHLDIFDSCERTLDAAGRPSHLALPEEVIDKETFSSHIARGTTIGPIWAIAPAVIAVIAVWHIVTIVRKWMLDRIDAPAMPFDTSPDVFAAPKMWEKGSVGEPPDPDSTGIILDGHCTVCNLKCERETSTELACCHRVHDGCIKELKRRAGRGGLACPICAPARPKRLSLV